MSGITCSNGSSDSAHPKWKQISGTIKGGLVLPDKVIRTGSDGRKVERLLRAEIPIPTRSLVTSTYINSSNKRNLSKKTVSTPSKRICSNSTAGGTYCIARWCGNNAKKTPGISLFRIPKDPDRALLWLTNAEREDLKILSMEVLHTKYLCMEHFNEDMFMNSYKKKLVWNALPTNFPKPDYAFRIESKNSAHHRQQKCNVPQTAKCIGLSKFHQPTKRRPLKPKPLSAEPSSMARFYCQPYTSNTEEFKSVAISVSSVSSLANSSQCIKKEKSTLKEIQTIKMKINDTNAVPNCQITSKLSVQGNSMVDQPNTKLAAKCQEPVGHTETAHIITCNGLNEFVGSKEDKVWSVTSTSEYLSLGSTDSIHHEGDHSDLSTVGENKRNVNDKLISDESYLNCDVESLCLEHTFRETERIYPCRYCGEMFLVKSNLILHQTTYHSDHPVGCELCGKVLYKSRSEFMGHLCEHHSENTHN